MKAETVIPGAGKSCGEKAAAEYAKKVKRHRIKLAAGAVIVSVIAACVLFLIFLTIKDMHDRANPMIYEVEAGTYNLTSSDLEVAATDVEDYIFFTNTGRIEVAVEKGATYSGEVLLWNADDRNNPVTILYGNITSTEKSCAFTGLSSAHRYRITCDGNADLMLTITDGRNVSFFGSMKNVFDMILEMILIS